jgi:hypothetical protein
VESLGARSGYGQIEQKCGREGCLKGFMTMTDFAKVIREDSEWALSFAKKQIEGKTTGLEKHDYIAAIEKHAAATYGDTMGKERSFAKAITEDNVGRLLYRALKAAPGSEIKSEPPAASGDAPQDFVGRPAHARLHSMTVDHVRANPRQSYQSAYSFLYTKPENSALREQIKAEHFASIAKAYA